MQKILLAALSIAGLLAGPAAHAGGGVSFASGLMGGIVSGTTQERVTPAPHPPQRQADAVPTPLVKPTPAVAVIPSHQTVR